MMRFNRDEMFLMMLYSPGDRSGLIKALKKMRGQLAPDETFLSALSESVIYKLSRMSDEEFEKLDLYAGLEGLNGI